MSFQYFRVPVLHKWQAGCVRLLRRKLCRRLCEHVMACSRWDAEVCRGQAINGEHRVSNSWRLYRTDAVKIEAQIDRRTSGTQTDIVTCMTDASMNS